MGVDPRVLVVRAIPADQPVAVCPLDLRCHVTRIVHGGTREHVRIDHAGHVLRLDIVEGTLAGGPTFLQCDLAIGARLPAQVATALTLRDLIFGTITASSFQDRLADSLLRLWAFDASGAGASLREIADLLLGPGDWPGDGEHRKSRVRRLVAWGRAVVVAGPSAVLNQSDRRFANALI